MEESVCLECGKTMPYEIEPGDVCVECRGNRITKIDLDLVRDVLDRLWLHYDELQSNGNLAQKYKDRIQDKKAAITNIMDIVL